MTSHFSRYVSRQLISGTALVSAGLVFLVWLTQSLRYLQFVMGKGLPIETWMMLTVLMLPPALAIILPIALFAVVVFVYNRLALDRELVVLQAAGLSRWGLARPALIVGAGATALGFILNLSVVPASMRAFKELQWSIRNDVSQLMLREGSFNQVGAGLTIYVRERAPDGTLSGLLIHDTRQASATTTLMARQGTVERGTAGSAIRLIDGSRQERSGADDFSVLTFDTYALDLGVLADGGESRWLDNGERSATELLSLTEADGHSATTIRRMRADAHNRFASPLLILALAMIGVVWLLLGDFDRRGALKRIGGAVVSIVGVEVALLGFYALAAREQAWIAGLYVTGAIPIAVCSVLLAGAHRRALVETEGRLPAASGGLVAP